MSEALVIGGGLAGGAVATMLARAGRPVRLFERSTEPVDKICGEFLSREAQRVLDHIGVDLDHLGATRISALRLAWGLRTIETPLPFVARGLSRRRLDTAILEKAETAGARVERGVAVRAIGLGHVETTLGDFQSQTVLLASGKHDVRGVGRETAGCEMGYVGFKTYWRLSRQVQIDLSGKIDVILFEGGYAGLQMVEDRLANLCLVVTKPRLAALGGRWSDVLNDILREPHAASMLEGAEQCSPRPLTIAAVPYGFLHSAPRGERLFRLGDQAAVIPSFCGEGMAIALHSARVAAHVIIGGGNAAAHRAALTSDVRRRLRIAMAVQRAGQAPWSRSLLFSTLQLWPRLAAHLTHFTRIPQAKADAVRN